MAQLYNLSAIRVEHSIRAPIRLLEEDEEARLLAAIRKCSVRYFDLSNFLLDTGAKLGEALTLAWASVGDESVTFPGGKSAICRTIPLTKRASQAVTRPRGFDDGPYTSIRIHDYRAVWKQAKLDAGIIDTTLVPGALRHACAIKLVKGGVDLRTVQKWLGHKSLAMTMRYAQYVESDFDSCVRALERREAPLPTLSRDR